VKHWIDPNIDEQEPHGFPASANGLIVQSESVAQVTLAAGYLVMDSYAWARALGNRLAADVALGRVGGGQRQTRSTIASPANYCATHKEKSGFTPDFQPLVLRAQLLPRRVLAATGELRPYAHKLLAVAETRSQNVKAPDFILRVEDHSGTIRVIHKFAYVADFASDLQASVVNDKEIIDSAIEIMKRARDKRG